MSKEIEKQPEAENKGLFRRISQGVAALFGRKNLGIHQGGYGLSDEQNQKAIAAIAEQAAQEAEEEFAARAKAAEAETETSETETEAEAGGQMPPKKKMEGDDNEDDSEDTPDCKTIEPENQTNEKTPTQSEEIMNNNIEALLEKIVATNQLLVKASEEQAKKIEAIEQAQKNAATQPEQPQRPAPNAAIHSPAVKATGEKSEAFSGNQDPVATFDYKGVAMNPQAMQDFDKRAGSDFADVKSELMDELAHIAKSDKSLQQTISQLGGKIYTR